MANVPNYKALVLPSILSKALAGYQQGLAIGAQRHQLQFQQEQSAAKEAENEQYRRQQIQDTQDALRETIRHNQAVEGADQWGDGSEGSVPVATSPVVAPSQSVPIAVAPTSTPTAPPIATAPPTSETPSVITLGDIRRQYPKMKPGPAIALLGALNTDARVRTDAGNTLNETKRYHDIEAKDREIAAYNAQIPVARGLYDPNKPGTAKDQAQFIANLNTQYPNVPGQYLPPGAPTGMDHVMPVANAMGPFGPGSPQPTKRYPVLQQPYAPDADTQAKRDAAAEALKQSQTLFPSKLTTSQNNAITSAPRYVKPLTPLQQEQLNEDKGLYPSKLTKGQNDALTSAPGYVKPGTVKDTTILNTDVRISKEIHDSEQRQAFLRTILDPSVVQKDGSAIVKLPDGTTQTYTSTQVQGYRDENTSLANDIKMKARQLEGLRAGKVPVDDTNPQGNKLAVAAESFQPSRKDDSGYCQRLAGKAVQKAYGTSTLFGVPMRGNSAMNTMRMFQSSGVGFPMGSQPLQPGDIVYSSQMGGKDGHVMIIGKDGTALSDLNPGTGLGKGEWVIRPSAAKGGAVGGAKTAQTPPVAKARVASTGATPPAHKMSRAEVIAALKARGHAVLSQ